MSATVALATAAALFVIAVVTLMGVGYVRAARYASLFTTVRHARVSLSERYDGLKTGDVVLFIPNSFGFAHSSFMLNVYSHAAVVLCRGGRKFLSEALPASTEIVPAAVAALPHVRHGSNIVPLLARLKHYCGFAYLMRLRRPLSPSEIAAIERAALSTAPYPNMAQILAGLAGLRTRSRHCFQHTRHVLTSAGIVADDNDENADFIESATFVTGLPATGLYDAPVHLVYDCDIARSGAARCDDQKPLYAGEGEEAAGEKGGEPAPAALNSSAPTKKGAAAPTSAAASATAAPSSAAASATAAPHSASATAGVCS